MEGTAVDGEDYLGGEGVLQFGNGELQKDISLKIINNMNAAGREESFQVELYDIIPEGAKKGEIVRSRITITDDDEFDQLLDGIMALTNANLSELSLYQSNWKKQFQNAMTVNSGDLEHASAYDYVLHVLTFGLKVMFATAPPPGKGGGWPCFWVSLFYIGICALVIGDMAKVLGCLIGLKDEVTAITLVTFGTSQIDLFASKIAAVNDPTADNSIGNVVAANAIGVFLGLGFPWLAAAIYWEVTDPSVGFIVPSSDISFQVGSCLSKDCLSR